MFFEVIRDGTKPRWPHIFVLVFFTLCFLNISCLRTKRNLADYNKRIEALKISQQVMPNLRDLPAYEKIYYQYRHITNLPLIFYSETMLLVVTYDETTYQIEQSKINNYNYLNEAIFKINTVGARTNQVYQLPEPEFEINSFSFKVLEANRTNDFWYPNYIGIIATSNEKNSIAYLYFEDQDLDYISEDETENAMVKFVEKYFKYKW